MNTQPNQPGALTHPPDKGGEGNPQRRRGLPIPAQPVVDVPIKSDSAPTWKGEQEAKRQRFLQEVGATVTEIRQIGHQIDRGILHGFHRIGRILLRDAGALSQGEQTWITFRLEGTPLSAVAEAVGMPEPQLSSCRKFAREFQESEVDALVSRGVNWGHVLLLTGLSGGFREELIERIATEKLTVNEVAKLILQKYPNQRPGSGRRPKPPPTPARALIRLDTWLCQSRSRALGFLFGHTDPEYYLPGAIDNTPPDELTPELRDQVASAATKLRELAEMAMEAAQDLGGTLDYFDKVFERRQNRG